MGARLEELGYTVERLAGADRFATSAAPPAAVLDRLGADPRPLVVATGSDYPDALAAGAVAARLDAPLLLVDGRDLAASPAVGVFLAERGGRFDRGIVLGGTTALTDLVRDQLAAAL